MSTSVFPPAPFGSRLLAILYDSLIVFFIIIFSIIILQFFVISVFDINTVAIPTGTDDTAGKEIPADSFVTYFFKSLWLILSLLYFSYFWTKRGQTPGMKVWKLKVVRENDKHISWYQAMKRYLFAFFGLGLIWVIFNKKHSALQDILSSTHLISIKNDSSK